VHRSIVGSAPLVTITPVWVPSTVQLLRVPPLPWSRNQAPVAASRIRQSSSCAVAPSLTDTAVLRTWDRSLSTTSAREPRSRTNSASGTSCTRHESSTTVAPSLTHTAG
jgi:hypothetical protein